MILYSMGYVEVMVSRILQVEYGSDMTAPAKNQVVGQAGYKIMLGDRRSDITLKRMALSLSVWAKFVLSLVTVLAAFFGLRCALLIPPALLLSAERFMDVLVRERDVYLTYSLQKAVRSLRNSDNVVSKVVGIVGEGHVPGILSLWGSVTEEDVARVVDTERL